MQPSDAQPPKQEKVGFFAKLFGKKPKTPVVPPHVSQTPPPQLGNDADGVPSQPAADMGTGLPPVNPSAPVDGPSVSGGVSDVPPSAGDSSAPAPGSNDPTKTV